MSIEREFRRACKAIKGYLFEEETEEGERRLRCETLWGDIELEPEPPVEEFRLPTRYLVFAYSEYYPAGGLGDLKYATNDLTDAIRKAKELVEDYDWVDILDARNMRAITVTKRRPSPSRLDTELEGWIREA